MLIDEQRAFARVCLMRDPSEQDLAELGGMRERYFLYRHMVRTRLKNMVRSGLERTIDALGEDAYGPWFDRWLDEAPPRTRFIREVINGFAEFVLPLWKEDDSIPAWLPDLCEYEAARWAVAYDERPASSKGATDLSFEKPAALNPTLRIVVLDHPVQKKPEAGQVGYPKEKTRLLIYRRPDNDRTATWLLKNDLSTAMVKGWAQGEKTVAETVKTALEQAGLTASPKFAEELGAMLAQFIEQGIVLGALPDDGD